MQTQANTTTTISVFAAALVAALLGLVAVASAAAPPVLAWAYDQGGVAAEPVQFEAQNPGDPLPVTLSGVRYRRGPVTPDVPAIVLVHGTASTHRIWDWDREHSVARSLASAGYVVIAYDRLGFGASPYDRPKSGYLLTLENQRDMLHEVVEQVKEGSYLAAAPGGARFRADAPSPTVVLIGHSAGGAIVGGYAGKYGDVAAVVQATWSNPPRNIEPALERVLPQLAAGNDYFDFFGGDPSYCAQFALHLPGIDPAVADAFCTPPFSPSPAGEFLSVPAAVAANQAFIAMVGPRLPVLLTFADNDFPITDEGARAEAEYCWNGDRDVEVFEQPDSGHAFQLHQSIPAFIERVVTSRQCVADSLTDAWLAARRRAHAGASLCCCGRRAHAAGHQPGLSGTRAPGAAARGLGRHAAHRGSPGLAAGGPAVPRRRAAARAWCAP